MFNNIFDLVKREFSGINAKEITSGIAKYHRIQSSPGFRAAAEFCESKLLEYNIKETRILSFPAEGNNTYWGCPIPKEWAIDNAKLELIEPKENARTLCVFRDNPCSIIQRSRATPKDGIVGDVVILPKGLSEEEIQQFDLKGKFILTDEPNLKKLREIGIKKGGALGIIYDLVTELPPLRTRENFPTARRYTSFWYGDKGMEGDALGFVLNAELGSFTRKLIKKIAKENNLKNDAKKHKSVKVKAKINSKFYNGSMEVVEFCIPGYDSTKEVIAVAHLCHPKPSAVDNASGCGALIETARTLQELIENGKLKKPKRTIRFILMAEFTGTYCYLATNEDKVENFVAGINLDMVGADQSYGERVLQNIGSHTAAPSYVDDVMSSVLKIAVKEGTKSTLDKAYPSFKFENDMTFSGGSDHYLLGYPDIGIGTPMLCQWPDRFYHTGEDTIEKVSEDMMKVVGSITATYCYYLANADTADLIWISKEVGSKSRKRVSDLGREYLNEILSKIQSKSAKEKSQYLSRILDNLESKFLFRKEVEFRRLESIKKLFLDSTNNEIVDESIESEKSALTEIMKIELEIAKNSLVKIAKESDIELISIKGEPKIPNIANQIPVRVFRGPVIGMSLSDLSLKEENEFKEISEKYAKYMPTLTSMLFWIDGKRSILEISKLVEAEHDETDIQFIVKVLKYYEKHGLIKMKKEE